MSTLTIFQLIFDRTVGEIPYAEQSMVKPGYSYYSELYVNLVIMAAIHVTSDMDFSFLNALLP